MRCVIRGASIVAVGILASLAVAGCDKDSTSTSSTTSAPNTPPNRVLLAQYSDAGGMPNPMPGSPLGDAGFAPIPPSPRPGPSTSPGNPVNPGGPTYPGNPGSPGSPGNPTPPPGH
jgi:hypothetical protein